MNETLHAMLTLVLDLCRVWLPFPLAVFALTVIGAFGVKTFRTARSNAAIRAERKAAEAWLAPVIPFPVRNTNHVA